MNHSKTISETDCTKCRRYERAYINEQFSDVALLIEDTKIVAHKVILATQSVYFCTMFNGDYKEVAQNEIELVDVSLFPFKYVLKYIYTGHISLAGLDEQNIIDVMELAHYLGVYDLMSSTAAHLKTILTPENCLVIYRAVMRLSITDQEKERLRNACQLLFDENASNLLKQDTFATEPEKFVCTLLKRDTFFEPHEINIFYAVQKWIEQNPTVDRKNVLSVIRWPLITKKELLSIVLPSNILETKAFWEVLKNKATLNKLPYRYLLPAEPNQNIVMVKYGARVSQGGQNISHRVVEDYFQKNGAKASYYGRVEDDVKHADAKFIFVKLPAMINYIELAFDIHHLESCLIEISEDGIKYDQMVEHKPYRYGRRQYKYLYFSRRFVRYIRVTAHSSITDNNLKMKAMFKPTELEIINGVIKPNYNVATTSLGAEVFEGLSPLNLLNGIVDQYDDDTGYTTQNTEKSCISIALNQPYIIDSMRLLLWDRKDCTYSFYIQTSTDCERWRTVADKRNERLKSWQEFKFSERIVEFIRITGTSSSLNHGLRCVHFECSSRDAQHTPLDERNSI